MSFIDEGVIKRVLAYTHTTRAVSLQHRADSEEAELRLCEAQALKAASTGGLSLLSAYRFHASRRWVKVRTPHGVQHAVVTAAAVW